VVTLSNRELVQQLRSGARPAVGRLLSLYQARLIGEAVRVFRVPHPDAEELVDDVLLSVVERVGTFEFRKGDGDFHVWVMAIFRNRVRDFMRKWIVSGALGLTFDEARADDELTCTAVEREVMGEIVRRYSEETAGWKSVAGEPPGTGREKSLEAISTALDALESWERVLLRCRALEVPYEEIAAYTGKKPEHLKVYHGRVRKKFLALLTAGLEQIHGRSSG
jgi:RNA polymerase sigma factor (sigma-70 family)